ncbi:MAG: hypothetical protein HY355_05180 [Armatimonadetes bacterium]|nr:hypothetical protein [Armatimonadota bacterium]
MLLVLLALAVPASTRPGRVSAPCLPSTREIETLFRRVADAMYLAVRENIPRPCLRDAASMPPAEFSRLIGFKTPRVFNAYLPQINTIVLATWRQDALAHEFVHYFQVKYQGVDLAADARDWTERQATAIQNLFRNAPALQVPAVHR